MGIENKTKEINTPEQPQQKELASKQENRTLFAKDLDHNNSISKPEAKTIAPKTDIPNKKTPEKSTATNRDVKPAEVKPPERKSAPPTDIKQERLNQKAALEANRTISAKKSPESSVGKTDKQIEKNNKDINSLSYEEIHKKLATPEGRAELTKMNTDFREGYEAEIRGMSREEYRDFKEKNSAESDARQEANIDKNSEKTDITDKNYSDNGDGPPPPHGPDVTDKVEMEMPSPFAKENFKAENSFDAKAKKDYPDLNDLKNKNVYDVKPMGTEISDSERTPKGAYTPEERNRLKEIRDKIDVPTTETVMQKVIGVASGVDKESIKRDLSRYLNPTDKEGKKSECQVFGYVSKAEDVAPFTKSPQECHDNLRLDYPGTVFKNPNESVYVIRFTDGKNYDIPYSEEFGGTHKESQPFTGDGFIASEDVTIPEYKVRKDEKDKGAIVTDGEIYRINPDGKEELVAKFDRDDEKFYLVSEEDKQ